MGIFYYDQMIQRFEELYQWDQSLAYLDTLYKKSKDRCILYSLIGFSWFYLVEGPLVSKKYDSDSNVLPLNTWKKYVDIGVIEASSDPFFNFITGYTLNLHGSYIGEKYEKIGIHCVSKCMNLTENPMLRQLAENFISNDRSTEYKPIKDGEAICSQFFNGKSLLERYFAEVYSHE